jgi:hypothetical protein
MKLLTTLAVMASLTLVGCASKKVAEKKDEGRKFKKDYVLVDASAKELPNWIDKPSKGDKSKVRKKNRYFVNESAHSNKRLCERSAEARATARIAQEIAQFMKNSYAEATQGGADEDVTEYMQEQLATESQAFIIGASVLKTYWEKRGYKESLGAEEDMSKYTCFALVKMSKKSLEKAVKKSRAKLLGEIEDPEVKKKTDKALDHVAKKFNDLDEKVKVEEAE